MSVSMQAANVSVLLHADNRHYSLENPYVNVMCHFIHLLFLVNNILYLLLATSFGTRRSN